MDGLLWDKNAASSSTGPCTSFTTTCSARDAAGRELSFARPGLAVDMTGGFAIQPDRPYDDPSRNLVVLGVGDPLTVSSTFSPPCGLVKNYELAVWADPASYANVYDPGNQTSAFTFNEPGAYYIQGMVGRDIAGAFDAVKLSDNVIVALVTGYGARIVTPDAEHLLGVAAMGARYLQDMQVQLTSGPGNMGPDVAKAGVELELRVGGLGILSFGKREVMTLPVVTDGMGTARAPVYSLGYSGPDLLEVWDPHPRGGGPPVVLDQVVAEADALAIRNPHGDPAGADAGPDNEFCFNADSPGRVEIGAESEWETTHDPIPAASDPSLPSCDIDPEDLRCRLTWTIDAVGESALSWENPYPVDTSMGFGGATRLSFLGLPSLNDHFGLKMVTLWYDDEEVARQPVEVFYPLYGGPYIYPANHYGMVHYSASNAHTFRGDSDPCANFFFYGRQIMNPYLGLAPDAALYDSTMSDPAILGTTPAVYDWLDYEGRRDITLYTGRSILCYRHPLYYDIILCGFDLMRNVFIHENYHVEQILAYNATGGFETSPMGIYSTGTVTSSSQTCPGGHCGWAFAKEGMETVPPTATPTTYPCLGDSPPTCYSSVYYNRFQDGNSNHTFDGCPPDICLDEDDDLVPREYDFAGPSDDAYDVEHYAEIEESIEEDEFRWAEWFCPGRNSNIDPCY
jgi:hypothetical protein